MAGDAANIHRLRGIQMSHSSETPKRRARKNVNQKPKPEPSAELISEDGGNKPPAETTTATPDPFDPAALRINPDTAAGAIGVKRKLLSVKCGKPNKQEFVRVHPDESFRIDTAIVVDKANHGESYLVAPALWTELPDFITLVRLCLAVNRHGTPFLLSLIHI